MHCAGPYVINDWAKSAKGNQIELTSSHPLSALSDKQPLLFIGGVHGDEPEGVKLAEEWLAWLATCQSACRPWIVIRCINPDGYLLNQRTNGNGVDLNRNFPSQCWSPDYHKDRYFPGSHPASEPETQALVQLIRTITPSLIVHFHSWEPSIVYANAKAKQAAEYLARSCGYLLQEDIGYPTPGSLGEYGSNDLDIGVICIEEQEGEPLDKVFAKFKQGLIDIVSMD